METMMGRIEKLTTEPTGGTWNPHRKDNTAELKILVQQMKGLVADMSGIVRQINAKPVGEDAIRHIVRQEVEWLAGEFVSVLKRAKNDLQAETRLIVQEEAEKLINALFHEINHCNQKCATKKAATPDKSQTVADNLYSPETLEAIKKTAEHVCCPEAAMWAGIKSALDEAAPKSTAAALIDALWPTKQDETLTKIVRRVIDEELQKKRTKGE